MVFVQINQVFFLDNRKQNVWLSDKKTSHTTENNFIFTLCERTDVYKLYIGLANRTPPFWASKTPLIWVDHSPIPLFLLFYFYIFEVMEGVLLVYPCWEYVVTMDPEIDVNNQSFPRYKQLTSQHCQTYLEPRWQDNNRHMMHTSSDL